jgi:hypothetical protein
MSALSAAVGRYPHSAALLDGTLPPGLDLAFDKVAPINLAFAPMVRSGRYDLCEMAIATFLQARAWGSDLVLLPATGVEPMFGLPDSGDVPTVIAPDLSNLPPGETAVNPETGEEFTKNG